MGTHPFRCVFFTLLRRSIDADTPLFSNKANLDAHRRRFIGSLMRDDELRGGMFHRRVPRMDVIRQTHLRQMSQRNVLHLSEMLRPRTTHIPPRKAKRPPPSGRTRNSFGEFPYLSAVTRRLGNQDDGVRKRATLIDYASSSTSQLFATSSVIS